MDVLALLKASSGWFGDKGVASPRLNAEHLLAKVLGCGRMDLYLQFDRPVSEAEKESLRGLLRRRAAGVPLQHLLGEWDFWGRRFAVDARALIPRPETELLVEIALAGLPQDQPIQVVDCGTGSGIIALTLALERPAWNITATDSSPEALALAHENWERLGCAANCSFWEGDLLPPERRWMLIAANLPYIPTSEIDALAPEVRHDPKPALDGGPDGLGVIRRLVECAEKVLDPGGRIILEFGAGQEMALQSLLGAQGFHKIQIHADHQGIPRIVEAEMPDRPCKKF